MFLLVIWFFPLLIVDHALAILFFLTAYVNQTVQLVTKLSKEDVFPQVAQMDSHLMRKNNALQSVKETKNTKVEHVFVMKISIE